jgi:C4-type Zn-finger protein
MLAIKEGPKIDDPTTGAAISKVDCPFCHHEIGHIMPWGKIPTESDVMGEL